MTTGSQRRIGLVTPLYAPAVGGVERYVERLATGLVARGLAVEVITTDPGSRSPSVDVRDGVTVRRFPTVRGDAIYFASPRLSRWLLHHADSFELMHAHNLHTLVPVAAAYAARQRGVPLVITAHYHGTGHTPLRRLLHVPYRPVARRAVRFADRIVCNSAAECALLRHDFGDVLRTTLVPEGIDLPGLAPAPTATDADASPSPDPKVDPDGRSGLVSLLTVGRLEAYKSVERIVEALPHLPATHRLVVVGEGPARASIESAATRLGLGDRVVMRGRVSDDELVAWYASAAVSISLSRHESFGLVVLEAAAAGCPVVAADIPALREAAGYAPPGRIALVDLDASSEVLAAAISGAIARGRSQRLTTTERAPGWTIPTWDSLVDGVLRVYDDVMAARRDASSSPAIGPAGSPRPDRRG